MEEELSPKQKTAQNLEQAKLYVLRKLSPEGAKVNGGILRYLHPTRPDGTEIRGSKKILHPTLEKAVKSLVGENYIEIKYDKNSRENLQHVRFWSSDHCTFTITKLGRQKLAQMENLGAAANPSQEKPDQGEMVKLRDVSVALVKTLGADDDRVDEILNLLRQANKSKGR